MDNIEESLQRVESGTATVDDAVAIRAHIERLQSIPRVMTVEQIADALHGEKVAALAMELGISENTLYTIRSGERKSIVLRTAQKLTDYFLEGDPV